MHYTLIVSVQQPAKEQTLRLGQSTIYKQPHRLGTNLIARAFLLFEPLGPSMSFSKSVRRTKVPNLVVVLRGVGFYADLFKLKN